jgi:phosphatidylserine decarboxylase
VLSPADGRVVYVKQVQPFEPVITIKGRVKASVNDIVREDMAQKKVLIGVFMSPFNVHYNRAPLSGRIVFTRHHPPKGQNQHMGFMHLRTLLRRRPYYHNSLHVSQNERTVTRIDAEYRDQVLACYVVQIAGKKVNGIDSYVAPGSYIERGAIFGMIRVESQVDLIVPWIQGMQVRVSEGDKVRAGETLLIQ